MLALALLGVSAAHAQDTRTVTEPVIPPACVVLKAQSTAADDAHPDTTRIQSALDHCTLGHAVELKPEAAAAAFLTGPIQLRAGVTLLIDAKATLYASRNPRDYDVTPGSCGIVNQTGHGCKPAHLRRQRSPRRGDGRRRDRWTRRRELTGQNVSWWDLAQEAKVKNQNQNCPRILVLSHADDFTLYRITLRNSPNFHVPTPMETDLPPGESLSIRQRTARNTDGIDPGNSTNVTITHCFINAGDDNVAIKAGHGAPTTHMTIAHNHFYSGHGMSIGSETDGGASAIRVTDLSIDGADNGIRIKSNSSRGGLVQDIVYDDVCIRDTKNPIYMDSNYSFFGEARDKLPMFTDITLRNVHIPGAGKITLDGFDSTHRLGMQFDNVFLDNPGGRENHGDPCRYSRSAPVP